MKRLLERFTDRLIMLILTTAVIVVLGLRLVMLKAWLILSLLLVVQLLLLILLPLLATTKIEFSLHSVWLLLSLMAVMLWSLLSLLSKLVLIMLLPNLILNPGLECLLDLGKSLVLEPSLL